MREAYLPDVQPGDQPDRIMLVTQTYDAAPRAASIYEYFLSDETRKAKEMVSRKLIKLSEYYSLRDRDLRETLARFPGYEVGGVSFAGDISLYRKAKS